MKQEIDQVNKLRTYFKTKDQILLFLAAQMALKHKQVLDNEEDLNVLAELIAGRLPSYFYPLLKKDTD